jgi:hypothetical protein
MDSDEGGCVAFLILGLISVFVLTILAKSSLDKNKSKQYDGTTVQMCGSDKSSSKTKTYEYTITSE